MTQTEFVNRVNAMVPLVCANRFYPVVFAFPPTSIGDDEIVEYSPTHRFALRFDEDEDARQFVYIYSLDDGFVGVRFEDTGKELRLLGAEKFEAFDGFEFKPAD